MLAAKLKFDERYYFWALDDWKREIKEDFPFLRNVKERLVINMMESLEDDQRWLLAKALVKRFTKDDVILRCGDTFTHEEKQSAKSYVDKVTRVVSGKMLLNGAKSSLSEQVPRKIKRKKLKSCIIKALSPVLGDDFEAWGNYQELRYQTDVGPWKIMTYIDVGGRFHQLCYDHSIIVSESVHLIEGVSLLSWLGISSQTMWQDLCDSDVGPTAEALAKIIAHFINAVPKLLEGLTPD